MKLKWLGNISGQFASLKNAWKTSDRFLKETGKLLGTALISTNTENQQDILKCSVLKSIKKTPVKQLVTVKCLWQSSFTEKPASGMVPMCTAYTPGTTKELGQFH